jgi:drug/metabolite transporter (DMT)-like permease
MMLTRRQWLLLGVLALLWGLNWPMMKLSLRELSPLAFRAITMSGGTLTLIAFFAWRGVPLRVSRADAIRLAWLALPNIIGWHLCSIIGLTQLPAGRAVILAFTMPVWTVLISVLMFGERMSTRSWLAVVAATAAIGLLAINELTALSGRPIGVLWLQGAALSWALGTVLMRRSTLSLPTEAVTVWMMIYGSIFFCVLAALVEPLPAWREWHAATWWSLVYGVFLNFGYAQIIWFTLARSLPTQASAFSVMAVPVVGVASSAILVGEVPQATDWLAALCIVVAIASATGQRANPPLRAARGDNAAP